MLVNNAGVYGERPTLGSFTEQHFLHNFTTNAMGPFFVVQELLNLVGGACVCLGSGGLRVKREEHG